MIPCNDSKKLFNKYKDEFEQAALDVLRSGWYILGNNVQEFEKEFAKSIGSKYCVGVDNGTNAIKIGIQALGIGPGDEVIVQANTYIATVLGITANGATPVFVEPNKFYNMNENEIESKITKNTKAIIVTHLYGQATKMDKIVSLCNKYKLYLLEDCAQSHYAEYNGKKTGTFGTFGFFSFYPTKTIGAFGDAGAIVTDNEELYKKVMMLRNYGSSVRYHFELENGSNSRLDEMQAALLRIKIRHANEITNEKIYIANKYLAGIKNKLVRLPSVDDGCSSVWHLFVLETKDRDGFIKHMLDNGIKTDIHYPIPPHLSKSYEKLGYQVGDFPITEYFANHVVDLPIFNGMTDEEIELVIEAVNSYGK